MIELWAEAGPCDKSIDRALEYVDAVHQAGAHALKVQWFNPETLTIPTASRYDNTSGDAETQREMFSNPIYPYQLWEPVIDKCRTLGIRFVPSVFDFEAIVVANEFELPVLKIASGDITYHELLRAASDGRQVALSTGASTIDEIEAAITQLSHQEAGHILMACHLEYPTPYHRANVARTYALQALFSGMIPGFSDHTPGIDTIPLMVATGVQVIEKHFTLEGGKGYDSDFALTPDQLRNAALKIEGTVAVMGNATIEPDDSELPAREGARRSPYARVDIPAGKVIDLNDLIMLRPYYGVSPQMAARYVGRSFDRDIVKYDQLPMVTGES